MGSARRLRRQIDLDDVAAAAEMVAAQVKEALSRSITTNPDALDANAREALDLLQELDTAASALEPFRRRPWQKPDLPWKTIQALKAAEAGRAPTKFDKVLARFDRARWDARSAVFSFVEKLHSENSAKVIAGLNHHDPEERRAWESIADKTPFETWSLVRRMRKPPGPRGRPKGSGSYQDADEHVRPEMDRLIEAGLPPQKAALELAPRLRGGGTLESKARRLRRRTENKST